jgi:hypothetical protein
MSTKPPPKIVLPQSHTLMEDAMRSLVRQMEALADWMYQTALEIEAARREADDNGTV